MEDYIQFSAKTKSEAITKACIELGVSSDQLEIQVISEGSNGFFGIGSKSAECTTAYNNALKEAERTAPKYATREDCVAEFGEGQCQQAPAQAGMAPENQAQAQQSSGSFWMPLMAGYIDRKSVV